jgi:hypothetical protein
MSVITAPVKVISKPLKPKPGKPAQAAQETRKPAATNVSLLLNLISR